eukprot:TRINITY_DN37496_c0_g1_i3.p1 TRINITY_DN37496_c0_g1~~TRINITY_DN37496_c0_g1_i3.p1  ORF type:complete len:346 (-),score=119.49 TRINITY_DN37496_c0_g1_i3:21-1058(-)
MSQQAIWKELVKTSFRRCYQFPTTASHSWFPGHMHKGLGQIQRRMGNVDCVLEVHDARIPLSGRNYTFRETVNGARPHILVLNKQDLFPEEEKEAIKKKILANSPNISKVLFTNCRNRDCEGTAAILPTAARLVRDQQGRDGRPDSTVLVVGIPNVGKSTMINRLRGMHLRVGGRPAAVAAKPGWTKSVGERIRVCDRPLIYLLDTPGISVPFIKDMHMGMKLAACATLVDHLVGEDYIVDYLLYWMNINCNFSYVELMGLEQPEDDGSIMLAKSAIINKKFKKVKDMSRGAGHKTIPDQQAMAREFLKMFRSGKFGQVNLDCDIFSKISADRLHSQVSRGAKIY